VTERAELSADAERVPASALPEQVILGRWWRVAALALVSLVVLHFVLIGALIAAPQMVPPPVQALAAAYLVPWFVQDWRLFAPSPDIRDYAVYARGEYRDGGPLVRTPWISVLDPLLAAAQANRLAPAAVKLEIAHKAALFSTRDASPLAFLPSGRQALAERWAEIESQPAAVILLERLSAVALADAYPGRAFETVQIMVTGRSISTLAGVSPDDSETVFVLEPVSFPRVTR
jgi:hypothetical protein